MYNQKILVDLKWTKIALQQKLAKDSIESWIVS